MSKKFELESSPLVKVDEIDLAIRNLARKGLIVDSGQRRWSKRTGRYKIVWVAREFADQKNLN